ncbi:MAG TPA: carboxypeptidase regulatory-like domain-containing protein [Blastocatellia bacterium]|nr:carboxypeptidase regulatory-like domain-containing protein [Blastocatellia bacterium]
MKKAVTITRLFLLLMTFAAMGVAQTPAELRGMVADEFGAIIRKASISLEDANGRKSTAQTDAGGQFRFTGLAPGTYALTATAPGFAATTQQLKISTGAATPVNIVLKVVISEQLEVKSEAVDVSIEPDQNLSSMNLSKNDLASLPDDREELLQVLRAMAGGSETAPIFVDGFSEDRLPSKNSIVAVKIGSNPFSPEFSGRGNNRIEVITKPGSDKLSANFQFRFNDESLNARNAFAPSRAPLQIRDISGDLTGPIIRNRWGYFIEYEHEAQDENAFINATVLDPATLLQRQFLATALTPANEDEFTIRTNFLITKKNTIGLWYSYERETEGNQGVDGGFDLPERGFDASERRHTLRASLTSVIGAGALNELRLSLDRRIEETKARSEEPGIVVLDAFSSGGNQDSLFNSESRNRLDLVNNFSVTRKNHTIKTGARIEYARYIFLNRANFGGTFTFGSGFDRDAAGNIKTDDKGAQITITPIEQYRRTLLGLPGYGPSQFSITRGDPLIKAPLWEVSWFAMDDWRVSPRLMLSFGARHDLQTGIRDRTNIAPRFSFAWAADKDRKSVLRGGAGIFYDGMEEEIIFDTILYDGVKQRQFVIKQPSFFPDIPQSFDDATKLEPALRTRSQDLDSPYLINASVSYERKLPLGLFGSVNYSWRRGVHLLRTRNINAPAPGTGLRPIADRGPILQYESTGVSTRHELAFNWKYELRRKMSLFGNYILSKTRSDTDGESVAPADSYSWSSEWGPASNDQRHRVVFGGSVNLPGQARFSPLVQFSTGRPFNITTGRDNNGDTLFTDRPSFAAPGDPEAIITRFGVFNPNPGPGEPLVPRNLGRGLGQVSVDMNFTKTFAFGRPEKGDQKGKDEDKRFNLTLGANVSNLLNKTNLSGFSGVLSSSRFDRPNRALGARRITLTLKFSF